MSIVDEIKAPILSNMKEFESRFVDSMKSSVPLLNKITAYIVKRKGKQIRPMLVFLSAKIVGEINDSTYRAAALIEMRHTTTLVNDDVVDDSNERRGFFSVNALWKNKIAVLIGDFLLSKGLVLSLDNEDFHLLKIVSNAGAVAAAARARTHVFSSLPATEKQKIACARVATMMVSPTPKMCGSTAEITRQTGTSAT